MLASPMYRRLRPLLSAPGRPAQTLPAALLDRRLRHLRQLPAGDDRAWRGIREPGCLLRYPGQVALQLVERPSKLGPPPVVVVRVRRHVVHEPLAEHVHGEALDAPAELTG